MPITVFRSRVHEETRQAYVETGKKMAEIGSRMPGFVLIKTFRADDGEQVTIVEFTSDEHQQAWANHPEHLEARKHGRETWFDEYDISVCEVIRRDKKP
ncbi:antibiotic biosynthesis monooxygenase family protein [Paracoccus methylarcula]|nr:antibiotic biosynthesis monooxygenase [Paracoccus methylarcula]